VITTNGTYSWSFVTQIFRSGQPSHGDDRKMYPLRTLSFLLAATLNGFVTKIKR